MIVLLIVADSLKAGAPGFAGGGAETPFLDELAGAGTHFENFFASGAWTVPSLMSMMTGTLGNRLGVCRWRHPFPARRPTLLTAFAAAGFEVSCFHPYPKWGFLTLPGKGQVENSQDTYAVEKSLSGRTGQDRLVVILHWWTHLPYITKALSRKSWHAACDFSLESLNRHPKRIAAKLEESYLKSVSHFSEKVLARYVEAASSGGEKVLTVVTGDHGETWGRSLPEGRKVEQVYDLHGRWISDETIKVPFVLHGHGAHGAIPGGQSLGGLAGGVDLGPTVAELAGVPWPGPAPDDSIPGLIERKDDDLDIIGQSLAPSVFYGSAAPRREVITISSHNTHVPRTYPASGKEMWRTFAARTADSWFIWDGVDAKRSIITLPNGAAPGDLEADEIFKRLEALRQKSVDSAPMVPDEDLDALRKDEAKIARNLRSLGYLE
jgi:Sulfatase